MQYGKHGVVCAIFFLFTALLAGCGGSTTDEQIASPRAAQSLSLSKRGKTDGRSIDETNTG